MPIELTNTKKSNTFMTQATLRIIGKKFVKFSAVGAIVTPISLGSNFILLKYFNTPLYLTYVCIYAFSILLSFLLNSRFTFRTSIKFQNLVKYYGIYISGILIGVLLISIFRSFTSFENWVYPFLALPFTTMWNFFTANRYLEKQ